MNITIERNQFKDTSSISRWGGRAGGSPRLYHTINSFKLHIISYYYHYMRHASPSSRWGGRAGGSPRPGPPTPPPGSPPTPRTPCASAALYREHFRVFFFFDFFLKFLFGLANDPQNALRACARGGVSSRPSLSARQPGPNITKILTPTNHTNKSYLNINKL